MLLREVEYARPSSVDEAVRLLASHEGARALAGGQTLVNVMKARAASPDVLIDLNRLDDLRAISVSGDTSMETLNSLKHVGATYFFSKPLNRHTLVERMKEWVP